MSPFDLPTLLKRMPDGWGKTYEPSVHPSGCYPPSCPRYLMFRMRLGWDRPRWSEALRVGDYFHEVMQAARSAVNQPAIVSAAEVHAAANMKIDAQRIEWQMQHPDEKEPAVLDKELKASALGCMMGHVFCEAFPLDTRVEVIAVERTFMMPLKPLGLAGNMEGTLDTVLYDHKTERLWIEDHKSTKGEPRDRSRGLTFDTQSLLYRALWDGSEFRQERNLPMAFGVIHNIIQKPSIRQKTKSDESWPDYVDRCVEWYDDEAQRPTKKGEPKGAVAPPLLRSHVPFTRPPIQEDAGLLARLKLVVPWFHKELTLENYPDVGIWNVCHGRGGICKFMDLCGCASPRQWYNKLANLGYVKKDPEEKS